MENFSYEELSSSSVSGENATNSREVNKQKSALDVAKVAPAALSLNLGKSHATTQSEILN